MSRVLVLVLAVGNFTFTKQADGGNTKGLACLKKHLVKYALIFLLNARSSMNFFLQETEEAEFKRKREEAEAIAEAKTAKNRAKRQKKKGGKSKNAAGGDQGAGASSRGDGGDGNSAPLKKRRLVNGRELVFKKQGEDSDGEESDEAEQNIVDNSATDSTTSVINDSEAVQPSIAASKIVIHEDD